MACDCGRWSRGLDIRRVFLLFDFERSKRRESGERRQSLGSGGGERGSCREVGGLPFLITLMRDSSHRRAAWMGGGGCSESSYHLSLLSGEEKSQQASESIAASVSGTAPCTVTRCRASTHSYHGGIILHTPATPLAQKRGMMDSEATPDSTIGCRAWLSICLCNARKQSCWLIWLKSDKSGTHQQPPCFLLLPHRVGCAMR